MMTILIDKVRVYNFRSIKNCIVDLSPVTVLVGANNSGKTSFLRALYLALGLGPRRVTKEDFHIGENEKSSDETEIIIDIRVIPVDEKYKRIDSFSDEWREKQFGELINFDNDDKEYFSFRTKINYDILNRNYQIKRYKIKSWSESTNWEEEKHDDELKQALDGFPLFFIDAQRDIVQDLRDRSSYFGRMLNNIKIDQDLINEIEEKIKSINKSVVSGSEELQYLKTWASLLTYGAFISWQYKNRESEKNPFHTILALEEPEAHLHPHAQRTLYKQLSEMKGQKIISTHSPFIASQCNLDEIRHFAKQGCVTEVKALNLSSMNLEDQRKLRRQVLNTRGELLFAKDVVLFEGETEEQALPIFAEKYWGRHPYELGVNFVGVGGQNYSSFLKLLQSLEISWYIFSDGEQQSINKLKRSLREIGIDKPTFPSNVIVIKNKLDFESYLLQQGYKDEIKQAILDFKIMNIEFENAKHEDAKKKEIKREIEDMSDDDILNFMKAYRTKLSPIYSNIISSTTTGRSIPTLIRKLFEEMSHL